MKTVLVTGSRDFASREEVYDALNAELPFDRLIHGACPSGADRFAYDWWEDEAPDFTASREFPADWDTHGKKAGPMRNKAMIGFLTAQEGEKVVLSFWRNDKLNAGTRNCVAEAIRMGLEVKRFYE